MNSKLEKISLNKKEKKQEIEDFSIVWKKNWDIITIHKYIRNKLGQIDIQKQLWNKKISTLQELSDPYIQMEVCRIKTELEYLNSIPSLSQYQESSYYYLYQSLSETDKNRIKEIRNEYLNHYGFLKYPVNGYNHGFKKIEENKKSKCCSELLETNEESFWTCSVCGLVYERNIENCLELRTYSEIKEIIPNIRKKPVYKKSGHLQEKINQKLAFTKNLIPQSIIDAVKKQIKNEKIVDLSKLKPEDIRRILKKLGLEKYYEMDYNIFSQITGTKIIEFDSSLIAKIEQMFDDVVLAFESIENKNRSSMFVYDYTIHKLLEILDLNVYKRYFKPPKNPEKVIEYDRLWKKICSHLSWKFFPTSINQF